jgi:hypothetical protein
VSDATTIFISYRRQQTSGHAGRLYDGLAERFGDDRVFMDVAIEAGRDFTEQINGAVGACDALIVVLGRDWVTGTDAQGRRRLDDPGDVLRLEVEAALLRGVRVIPALVQGAVMPGEADLPPSLRSLAKRQAVELSDGRWNYDVNRLVVVLERVLEEAEAGAGPMAPRRGLGVRLRRLRRRAAFRTSRVFLGHPWRVFVGGIAAGLVIAAAALAADGYFAAPQLSIAFVHPQRYARTLRPLDTCRVQIRSQYSVSSVDFVLDGDNPIVQETDAPYGCDNTSSDHWNTCVTRGRRTVSPGVHRLTATVTDFKGNTKSVATTVRIPRCSAAEVVASSV